jgi:ABC-type lipoprotein export system ATPase subunit
LRRFRRDRIAFVSQRAADNLFPHLSLAEHVPDAGRACFEQLGVAHRLDARPSELSGGELARAAFAVALARATPFVIVDEPTAELDGASAELVLASIADAARRGTTFVVATHDPAVLAISDHVVELARGRNATAEMPPPWPAAAPSGRLALRVDGLTKSYGSVRVLEGVSLAVQASELAVIHGRSGSGKSTLLMLLGRWQDPDAGTIEVGTGWSELAYVPQRFGLVPELTVSENVELPARLAGLHVRDEALLTSLALDGLANRYPTEISIGQQQRVAVARALRLHPAVLLVDEPTSHQDAGSAELVWNALTAAAAAGTACLVATHEPDARRRAHISWELEAGSLRD